MEIWKDPKNIIFWMFMILLLFLILFGFISVLIKLSYKKAIEKKQLIFNEKIKHEQKLKKAIIEVQDQERKEIASELHDQISNKLNLIILNLNNLENAQSDSVKTIKQDVKKIISKNRDLSHYLFPVEIENIGILLTLQDLSIKYSSNNFSIGLFNHTPISFSDIQTEIQLYRVIQESLTNTLKYSKATQFGIYFRKFKEHVFLIINDNGIGFNVLEVSKGLGLIGIEARLNSINAMYKFKSEHNKGVRLIIGL